MSIFITIFAGVMVFVLGQFILKLVLEPIQELKKTLALVQEDMVFYANKLTNPKSVNIEQEEEIRNRLRRYASSLIGTISIIPYYAWWSKMQLVPEKSIILEVKSNLVGLSNSIGPKENVSPKDNYEEIEKIKELLGSQDSH